MTTTSFIQLGKLEAGTLGLKDLPFLVLPHPLGGLPPEKARERGRSAADWVVAYLKGEEPAPIQ